MRSVYFLLSLACAGLCLSSPGITGPLLQDSKGQPDPDVLRNSDGYYYVFSDGGGLIKSQTTSITGEWSLQPNITVVESDGSSFAGGIGSPSVTLMSDGTYVMYFAAYDKVFVATATDIAGPYTLTTAPILDPPQGMDWSAPYFFSNGGDNYLLYKTGQPFIGNGTTGICIRQISSDGLTAVGDGVEIFSVSPSQIVDGTQFQDIEGPGMIFDNGTFYAFFNAGVYCATTYRIVYATSSSVLSGPYEFGGTLLMTGTYQGVDLVSPGGIGFVYNGTTTFTFMSYLPGVTPECHGGTGYVLPPRYVHAAQLEFTDGTPSLAPSWSSAT